MKKLCFSLVWHEKVMIFRGYSSLRGRVSTPTCSPDPGTSFLRFLKVLKILIFLNRKFCRRIFHYVSKMLLRTKMCVIIGKSIEIDSKAEITGTGSKFQIRENSTARF